MDPIEIGSPVASGSEGRLVRVVARLHTTVDRKLLVAFVGIVALLVIIGILGLRVLGASNGRVDRLGNLQQRTATYQTIETSADQIRTLLAIRSGGDLGTYLPGSPALGNLTAINNTISSTLTRFGQSLEITAFTPPRAERRVLDQIRSRYASFTQVFNRLIKLDEANKATEASALQSAQVLPLSELVVEDATHLANIAKQDTDALIADNASSYRRSQLLFIAVAAASVLLAVLLGYVLSRSLIVPIRRMGSRLQAIAAGDFSSHVEVANRDELGDLAHNLNRMNDELGGLYKELETVSRHKSEFLASMSHELRTPLNAIIGFSDVLGEQMFGELNEKQKEYVADILSAGRHLLSLINDILDLSKVEAGKMELDLGTVSIPDTLESGLTMQRERATDHSIGLSLEVTGELEPVVADERKVRQVVFNLLSNAVKFTADGGRIDVRARAIDGMVEVSVADTGVGIAPEDLGKVFEEFQQVGAAAGKAGGTGLGLPLSRKFVELHGGRMWVASTPGAGSTFTFTLPIAGPEAAE